MSAVVFESESFFLLRHGWITLTDRSSSRCVNRDHISHGKNILLPRFNGASTIGRRTIKEEISP